MIIGLLMLVGGMFAGVFGSLLGLGGGILIVPLLTLGFGIPLREAVGVSLVCVVVTSGAAASVYLRRGTVNLRLGMVLELFTAIGALFGGLIAFMIAESVLAGLFSALLIYVAATMVKKSTPLPDVPPPTGAPVGRGDVFVSGLAGPGYRIRRFWAGAAGSVGAGITAALLGIGGGLVNVPVMHLLMGVPLRIATATSNLMIGITASAGAIIYVLRGEVDAYVAGPTAIGVFIGAMVGSRSAHRIDLRVLRLLFVVVLLYTALQMGRRALGMA